VMTNIMELNLIPQSNGGSKPFRFFNYWLQCSGFKEAFEIDWSLSISGSSHIPGCTEVKRGQN